MDISPEVKKKLKQKRLNKIMNITVLFILFAILFAVLWHFFLQDMLKYRVGQELMDSGSYEMAYKEFHALGDYKDSPSKALDAYISNLEVSSMRDVSIDNILAGYEWALLQKLPKESVFRSIEFFLEKQPIDNQLTYLKWMDARGYESAKEKIYILANHLDTQGHYKLAYDVFSSLQGYKAARSRADYIEKNYFFTVTFDSQNGNIVGKLSMGKRVTIGDIYGDLPTSTLKGYVFGGWWTGKNGTGVKIEANSIVDIVNNQTLYAKFRPYIVGDIGPAGGLVFYNKGSNSDGWQYLEAAPANTEWVDKKWGGSGGHVRGVSTDIGTGADNTEMIDIKYRIKGDSAAKLCSDLEYAGYRDWFLPSLDELELMYVNLHKSGLGGFSDNYYWSSSQGNNNYPRHACVQHFSEGRQGYADIDEGFSVRAARAFR